MTSTDCTIHKLIATHKAIYMYLCSRALIDVVVSEEPRVNDPGCPSSAVVVLSPVREAARTKVTPMVYIVYVCVCWYM